jgi:hypothetical protein
MTDRFLTRKDLYFTVKDISNIIMAWYSKVIMESGSSKSTAKTLPVESINLCIKNSSEILTFLI